MDGSYSTHGDLKIYLSKFWSENLKVRVNSEDLGVGRRIILEWIVYEGVSKSFRTPSITKFTLTFGIAR